MTIAERPEAHINLGNLYVQRGEDGDAEASFRLALDMEPRAVAARVNLADLYRQRLQWTPFNVSCNSTETRV